MINPDTLSPRLREFVDHLLPHEHGHRQKAITDFVAALLEQHTCRQASLARCFDNFEAAVKRISRLVHNERFKERRAAEAILDQALERLPVHGTIRLAIDWTIENDQYLLVVSLVIGRRAIPLYWRAYEASVLKGRMKRYELSVIKRVLTRVLKRVSPRRVIVTADRGFADVELCDLLETFKIEYILRVKNSTKVYFQGVWRRLSQVGFVGNARHRDPSHFRISLTSYWGGHRVAPRLSCQIPTIPFPPCLALEWVSVVECRETPVRSGAGVVGLS